MLYILGEVIQTDQVGANRGKEIREGEIRGKKRKRTRTGTYSLEGEKIKGKRRHVKSERKKEALYSQGNLSTYPKGDLNGLSEWMFLAFWFLLLPELENGLFSFANLQYIFFLMKSEDFCMFVCKDEIRVSVIYLTAWKYHWLSYTDFTADHIFSPFLIWPLNNPGC